MKKFLLVIVLAVFSASSVFSSPVELTKARTIGLRFVKANIEQARDIETMEHVYTVTDDEGNNCLYVFNFNHGFVMVSASDCAKPILAYSYEGALDINNIPDGLNYYMNHYRSNISYLIKNSCVATDDIVAEWRNVENNGFVKGHRSEKGVDALINLRWDQDYPYNYYCPTNLGGPGGHAYAGCVATAMSMIMKFWEHPLQGTGSHSYTPSGYPQQTANFGETTYDWANMPISLSSSSPMTQITAVALLQYHCGVAVNMQYHSSGSGAYSADVPNAMNAYFSYSNVMNIKYRDNMTKTQFEDLLINNFDMGFPAYYSGSENNSGHAFVCDGYNDNRYFHFNWGWSGMGNGFYAIDALNASGYHPNDNQAAIFDIMPDIVYTTRPGVVENVTVTPENAYSKTAEVRWQNPSVSMGATTLENISSVVVKRNGVVVHTATDVTPGSYSSFVDEVPDLDFYTYEIYATSTTGRGHSTTATAQFGPTCTWRLMTLTTNFQGWNGGVLSVKNSKGTTIKTVSMTSSGNLNEEVTMPEGEISLVWSAPQTPVASITIILKDASNATVYTYNGASSGLAAGTIFSQENDCHGCQAPDDLNGIYSFENGTCGVALNWTIADATPQKYFIYRSNDNIDYVKVAEIDGTLMSYFDATDVGEYYYKVTAKYASCESIPAMTNDYANDYVHVQVTSLSELSSTSVKIYPNPASDELHVQVDGLQKVIVYNMLGQVVESRIANSDEVVLNTSSLEQGVYVLSLEVGMQHLQRRVTIVR